MRDTMGGIFLFGVSLIGAGCAAERAVMVNNRGNELTCEASGAGFFGAVSVHNHQQQCITDAEKRGYRLKD